MGTVLGLATTLMLLLVSSSASAQGVFKSERVGPLLGNEWISRNFEIPDRHVLVLTGYARAATYPTGPSTAWIDLVVIDKTGRAEASAPCTTDRMSTPKPGISSLKLHSSATCILVLCPGKFEIKGHHGVQHANRRKLQMDYALISHENRARQERLREVADRSVML